jgi:hypothetical protein
MSGAIPIGSFATRAGAQIVVGLCESEGIEASISADDAGGVYPSFEFTGGAYVLVDESYAKAAREALARRTEA